MVGGRGKDDDRGAEVQHKDLSNIEADQLCSIHLAEYPRKGNLHLALLWYESVQMWADRHEM